MSNRKENILDKATRMGLQNPSAGMSVPEGYFDGFAQSMMSKLPYREELENPAAVREAERPRTLWQKVRPYVYMAAMFAGVWCMLQMFTSLSAGHSLKPMSDNPVLAKALSSDEFMKDYIYDDLNSWEILDEMVEDGALDSDSALDEMMLVDSAADIMPAESGVTLVSAGDEESAGFILPQ